MRDTIRDSQVTTQDGFGNSAIQLSPNQTNVTYGSTPSSATLAVSIPPFSKCTLKSVSVVLGCQSSIRTPGVDQYAFVQLFNGTSEFRIDVFNGPIQNLASRYTGDISSHVIDQSEVASVAGWGSTTNNPWGRTPLPLYRVAVPLASCPTITTDANGKQIFIKLFSNYLNNNGTKLALQYSSHDTSIQDAWVHVDSAQYVIPEQRTGESSALASSIVAEVISNQPIAPPTCGLESIGGKLSVCWPQSYGPSYSVQIVDSLSRAVQPGVVWDDLAANSPVMATPDGRYCIKVPTDLPIAFFRLRSK